MWKDKPTGVKILWLWTIGTAAVLMTCVSRTRIQDMEKLMKQQEQQQEQQQHTSSVDSIMVDNFPSSNELTQEDKS